MIRIVSTHYTAMNTVMVTSKKKRMLSMSDERLIAIAWPKWEFTSLKPAVRDFVGMECRNSEGQTHLGQRLSQ